MSNIWYQRRISFSVAESLIEMGFLGRLSHDALKLYLGLSLVAAARSAVVVTVIPELQALLDLPDEQIAGAASELAKAGLVLVCRDASYHLLDPMSGVPLAALRGRTARGEVKRKDEERTTCKRTADRESAGQSMEGVDSK